MYGSTVNTQLTNDLLARASAQTAALSSQKTNTSTRVTGPQMDPIKTLAGLAAGQMANQVITPVAKAGAKKLGLDKLGDNITNALLGDGTPSAFAGDTTPFSVATYNPPTTLPIDTASISDLSNIKQTDPTGSDVGTAGGIDAGTAAAAGAATAAGASMLGGSAATTAAVDASYAIGGTGAFAAGASAAEGAATAATVAEGAGAAAEGAGAWEALSTAAVAMWIICTELNKQGRLPYRHYIYGAREFAKYDERGKQGYYIWAIPSVRHLRKHPNSAYSKLMEIVFNARAEHLAAKAGCKGARKTVLGAVTTHGLYAFCWILSRTIARKAYTKEQILNAGA
jgi:hypothetical protein